MKRGRYFSFRRILIRIIIVSLLITIGNFLVYYYYLNFLKSISGADSSLGEVSLIVETSSEPAPSQQSPATVASGGGGGVIGAPVRKEAVYDFIIDQALIKVSSKIGDTFKKSLTITNPNDISLHFQASSSLGEMIFISDSDFEVKAKSEKTIFLTFVATEDVFPDVYTAKIKIKTQYSEKELPVIYEVRTKKALFDVSLNIPARYKFLKPGDDLFFQVTLLNLGEIGKVDVNLEYDIKDFNGNIINSFEETVAVETQASFSKTVNLPDNIPLGDYVAAIRAKYGLTVSTASDLFSIGKESEKLVKYTTLGGLFVVIIILIIIVYELRNMRLKRVVASQNRQLSKVSRRLSGNNVDRNDAFVEIRKLNLEKELLQRAYNKGFIKKNSYDIGIRRIEQLIRQLKKRL